MALTKHDPWVFLAAGGVALGLILWRKQDEPAPSATASPAPSPAMRLLGEAIARAEGFFVSGSIPDRANNPGNLKIGTVSGLQPLSNGISVFPSRDAGWAALYRQLGLIATSKSKVYTSGPLTTIREMGNKWAPGGIENVAGQWASSVAKILGVSVDTPLSRWLA
jgi:hypothetical protein